MSNQKQPGQSKQFLSHHILQTAATMIGVCVTVIAFFRATNFHFKTYADKILELDTLIFISSCLFSYISLRRGSNIKFELIADNLFILGMLIMTLVGLLILHLE